LTAACTTLKAPRQHKTPIVAKLDRLSAPVFAVLQ
jgi:hypothetical protein